MVAAAISGLKVAVPDSFSPRKKIVMDRVNKLADKNSDGLVPYADLMTLLTVEFGFTSIEAAEKIRCLVDNELLFPIEDSGLNMFARERNITRFERDQERLQEAWLAAKEDGDDNYHGVISATPHLEEYAA
jgi:hypothetical protein